MTQCSAGLGAAPQQAEKPFVLWKWNEWFFAFVYTDALLAATIAHKTAFKRRMIPI